MKTGNLRAQELRAGIFIYDLFLLVWGYFELLVLNECGFVQDPYNDICVALNITLVNDGRDGPPAWAS